MLSIFSSRPNWDSPTARRRVYPPPPHFGSAGGGVHTRLRERGWGSPNSDEGTDTVVLLVYMYFVVQGSLITARLLVPCPLYNANPSRDNTSLWCAVISHALGPDSIRDNRALHMMKSGHVGETFF